MKLAIIEPHERYDKILEYITSGWALSEVSDAVPNIAGLAAYLGVGKPTLKAWCELDEDIAGLIEGMQAKQESMLISYGLRKQFSEKIVALLLAGHGHTSQSVIEHKGGMKIQSISSLSDDELMAIANGRIDKG